MTEKEAWLYLAKKWDEESYLGDTCEGFSAYVVIKDFRRPGLCHCLRGVRIEKFISQEMYSEMKRKLDSHGPEKKYGDTFQYRWPLTMTGAKKRAAFCRRMAKLCA